MATSLLADVRQTLDDIRADSWEVMRALRDMATGIHDPVITFTGPDVLTRPDGGRLSPDISDAVLLPQRTGPEVVRVLADRGIHPPTLLLTTFDDDEALVRGILAGARIPAQGCRL